MCVLEEGSVYLCLAIQREGPGLVWDPLDWCIYLVTKYTSVFSEHRKMCQLWKNKSLFLCYKQFAWTIPLNQQNFRRTVEWYTVTSVIVTTGVRNVITSKIYKLFFFFSAPSGSRELQSEKKRFAHAVSLHFTNLRWTHASFSLFLMHVWSWYFSLLIKQVYILPTILVNAIKHNKDNCTIVFQSFQRKNV